MRPEPELVHRVFESICETRRLNKAGYAKFRNFLLYGERGLTGQEVMVTIFQDMLTLEHQEEKLSRYSVEWQPDDRHLARVGNPWGLPMIGTRNRIIAKKSNCSREGLFTQTPMSLFD